ncbi:hypothetical protein [uncultured Sphingomonas sp.]|uniref:hypothetical protein n=1 Tax=uncultured Sphingomonas sp. TaxID=158754 RepID=UPI0025CC13FE|nr:hypothetical protein [uncultured Sphingomonas sp.]
MVKKATAALVAPPAFAEIGVTDMAVCANVRVVDAKTGETIERVRRYDVDAGQVSRFEVKDGNLVREGDSYKLIDEDREIRVEWINPPSDEPVVDEEQG